MSVPDLPLYDLADFIRKLRKTNDWTQEELSEISGVGVSTIRQIETRQVIRPELDTLSKFATAFKRDVTEFVSLLPGFQGETPVDTVAANGRGFPARRASDAGVSLRAREMAEAYDRLPPLAQIAIDAILRAFTQSDNRG